MTNRHLYWLAGILSLTGLAIFLYKSIVLEFPLSPARQTNIWNVEVKIHYMPYPEPITIKLFVPRGNSQYSITDEQFISPGYGLRIKQSRGNRQAIWTVRQEKREQVLYYRGTVHTLKETNIGSAKIPPEPEIDYQGPEYLAAQTIIRGARARSADTESLVFEIIKLVRQVDSSTLREQLTLLLGNKPDSKKRIEVIARILALEKIPARLARGIRLVPFERAAQHEFWLEVYHSEQWRSYFLDSQQQESATNLMPWWSGSAPLVNIDGGKLISVSTSVSRKTEPALITAMWREKATRPLLYEFSLLGLPLDTQAVYRVLMVIPLGVLLLVIMRNIIGIKTFGTFMPVLIAMAFRETQLLWGIILFTVVVGLGLAIRFYLEYLKLLLVPRLAAVLITVIGIMALISIISHKFGLYPGLSVALFPMVILTMTIERMSIVWEERGASEALIQGAGSLVVASVAYLIMNIELIRHLLFIFPELMLLLLAAALLLGRYSGYRLSELIRFKVLGRETQ